MRFRIQGKTSALYVEATDWREALQAWESDEIPQIAEATEPDDLTCEEREIVRQLAAEYEKLAPRVRFPRLYNEPMETLPREVQKLERLGAIRVIGHPYRCKTLDVELLSGIRKIAAEC